MGDLLLQKVIVFFKWFISCIHISPIHLLIYFRIMSQKGTKYRLGFLSHSKGMFTAGARNFFFQSIKTRLKLIAIFHNITTFRTAIIMQNQIPGMVAMPLL